MRAMNLYRAARWLASVLLLVFLTSLPAWAVETPGAGSASGAPVASVSAPDSTGIDLDQQVQDDQEEEEDGPPSGWWATITGYFQEIMDTLLSLPERIKNELISGMVNAVVGIVAYMLLSLFRLSDKVYLWFWDMVVANTPLGTYPFVARLWAQIWWFSMGIMIIVLVIQAGRLLTAGDSEANAEGFGGRKRWLSWLIMPIIGALLGRMSLFFVNSLTRFQNVFWRSVMADGLEGAAEFATGNSILPRSLLEQYGPETFLTVAERIRQLTTPNPLRMGQVQTLAELFPKGSAEAEILVGTMIPYAALHPETKILNIGELIGGGGFELAAAVGVVTIALLVLLILIALVLLSQLVLVGAALVGPVYFTLSAAKRDPTPGAGWFGLVVQTALVQSLAGLILRLLLITLEMRMGVVAEIGLVHLVIYLIGLGLVIRFWLIPAFNAVTQIATLNGAAVLTAIGTFTGGAAALLGAGGAALKSQTLLRTAANLSRAGQVIKDTGEAVRQRGEQAAEYARQTPGGWAVQSLDKQLSDFLKAQKQSDAGAYGRQPGQPDAQRFVGQAGSTWGAAADVPHRTQSAAETKRPRAWNLESSSIFRMGNEAIREFNRQEQQRLESQQELQEKELQAQRKLMKTLEVQRRKQVEMEQLLSAHQLSEYRKAVAARMKELSPEEKRKRLEEYRAAIRIFQEAQEAAESLSRTEMKVEALQVRQDDLGRQELEAARAASMAAREEALAKARMAELMMQRLLEQSPNSERAAHRQPENRSASSVRKDGQSVKQRSSEVADKAEPNLSGVEPAMLSMYESDAVLQKKHSVHEPESEAELTPTEPEQPESTAELAEAAATEPPTSSPESKSTKMNVEKSVKKNRVRKKQGRKNTQ